MIIMRYKVFSLAISLLAVVALFVPPAFSQNVTYKPYITPQARVVDNYLAADPALPVPPTAPGPHSNYSAVLADLEYDTTYSYRVDGPGMPRGGFVASFHTRKRGDEFSILVQGDEGFFPVVPGTPARLADYEARIVHLMYNVANLSVPGVPKLPKPDLALNTGDNVYTNGAEGSYRDYWFPVWNSDLDSNQSGAPFIRSIPFYIVVGNHDIGATGVNVNMLGGDGGGRFTGNTDGGDALAYFNNYYFPLNGPIGRSAVHLQRRYGHTERDVFQIPRHFVLVTSCHRRLPSLHQD
jgi:hypothetical protein